MRSIRFWHGAIAALVCLLAALPLVANAATPPFKALGIGMGNLSNYHFHDAYYTLQHNTYEHGSTLTGWLDLGFRSVELDVIDKDNWENDVNGPYVSHDKYAANENCSGNPDRLGHCLRDIVGWQDTHPGTGPILVFIDMKPSWDPAVAWQDDEVFSLDEKVRSILGSRLFTGNDLYQYATGTAYTGNGKSLRQAVSEQGWPFLSALNGKIIVAYTGGRLWFTNQTQSAGIDFIAAQSPKRLPFGFFYPVQISKSLRSRRSATHACSAALAVLVCSWDSKKAS